MRPQIQVSGWASGVLDENGQISELEGVYRRRDLVAQNSRTRAPYGSSSHEPPTMCLSVSETIRAPSDAGMVGRRFVYETMKLLEKIGLVA